jgi:tetratricopeptide (TPR) repeat protein
MSCRTEATQRKVADVQWAVAERERTRAEAARLSEAVQHRIADEQRDRALREGARAEQHLTQLLDLADRTLFEIHDAIAALPGAVEARQRVVRTTLDYLQSLEKTHGLDDRMRLVLSAAYLKIGATQGDPMAPGRQDSEGALSNYRKAETVLAPLYRREPDNPTVIFRWLQIEGGLADLSGRSGSARDAAQAFLALLPAAHQLGELGPSNVEWAKQEAETLESLARVLRNSSDMRGSLARADQAITLLSDLVGRFSADLDLKRELGSAYALAATSITDDLSLSAQHFERSVRMREQLPQARPEDLVLRRDLIVVYGNYSRLLYVGWEGNLDRHAEARAYCEKSVALARELAQDSRNLTAQYDLEWRFCVWGWCGQPSRVCPSRCRPGRPLRSSDRSPMRIRSRPAWLYSWPTRGNMPGNGSGVCGRCLRLRSNTGSRWPRLNRARPGSPAFPFVLRKPSSMKRDWPCSMPPRAT